ncbi:MAG TPA: HAD family phosphatase [Candidatus Methylomirabilis sp.]|nr:HAD family phosphatase [Candidatus Methylomirabilis sp.]
MTTVRGLPPLAGVLFDYGGVLAREGFRGGLHAIARTNGLDPEPFFLLASDVIYDTGYITGRATEADFWGALRRATGIRGTDAELTGEILSRFILRPVMIDAVRSLRTKGYVLAIASDQVDWLDRLDERDHFYREFDRVFNSYRLGKGKRDASVFDDMADALQRAPGELLFLDDNAGNVERAASRGMFAMTVRDAEGLAAELGRLPGLPGASP